MRSTTLKAAAPKPANRDLLRKRRKRLLSNEEALNYLAAQGVSRDAIDHFNMGLAEPYPGKNTHRENALVFPLVRPDGQPEGRYAYMNVPGVTLHPQEQELRFWMSGDERSYFSAGADGRDAIIVVSDPAELWAVWQALQPLTFANRVIVLSSTHPQFPPVEWLQRPFWQGWSNVYLALNTDARGSRLCAELSKIIEQKVHRLAPPKPHPKFDGSWTSFFRQEGQEEFEELFANAPTMAAKVSAVLGSDEIGRLAFNPVNINGAYHDGHLHYTVRTIVQGREMKRDADGALTYYATQHQETVVVRSDRTYHKASEMPAPRGTPKCDRIWRLGNTAITRPPRPNRFGTWRWDSINKYLEGRSETRSLNEIVGEIYETLLMSVYLPNMHDLWLLSLIVVVTYVQEVFDSVPLILAVGPPGTGKSTLGQVMARLCANGHVIGVGSPATIARTIDEVRGFIVLDDLEKVGKRRGTETGQFTELVQSLKVSYSKATATKTVTDVTTMTTETLNLYGVKLINNVTGADAILSTRMLKIQTAKTPASVRKVLEFHRHAADAEKLPALRDELHTWAFIHAQEVEQIYRKSFQSASHRGAEITAPIRVISSILGKSGPDNWLEEALNRQYIDPVDTEDHDALLRAAVAPAVFRGQTDISPSHVLLNMRTLAHAGREAGQNPNISALTTTWVGRRMRELEMIDRGAIEKRVRLHGHNLRIYSLNDKHIQKVLGQAGIWNRPPQSSPLGFCGTCDECAFTAHNCPIKSLRVARQNKVAHWASKRELQSSVA